MELAEGTMNETSGSSTISTKLHQVARLAQELPQTALTTLAHHIDLDLLLDAYRLAALERQDLDAFLCAVSPRQSRASLQHLVGHLRAFLRSLAADGEIPTGLDTQIDTPRVYRGEKVPRALPWDTVRALLDSIDRGTPMGRRDYAIFVLMATYGLRACEVVTLTLDDVEWRAGRLRIPQRKTRGSLWLPLTDEVGTALLDYLRHGRHALNVRRQRVPFRGGPPRSYRELFLRCRTPTGVLKPTAVTEAFQA